MTGREGLDRFLRGHEQPHGGEPRRPAATLSPRQGLDRLLREHEQNRAGATGGPAQRLASSRPRRDRSIALTDFPLGPPCVAMLRQKDTVTKALANGGRHHAILGSVVQLVRLGQQGHQGLGQALADIAEDFVDRVAGDRPGGRRAAAAEWNDAVQGALGIVLEAGYGLAPYACCRCQLADMARAVEGNAAFIQRGKRNERKVLRYLVRRAGYRGSLRVTESQRQLAEAIDVHQPAVCTALKRLQDLGWLTVMAPGTPWTRTTYHLHLPDVCKEVSTRSPAGTAGLLVDTAVHAYVHPLFGPRGWDRDRPRPSGPYPSSTAR